MKKTILFLAIASMAVFTDCKDDDGTDEQPTASTETTAEFDSSNFGLYKGVIVGSSGTVKIQINNGNNDAKADIVIDGRSETLTCSATLTNGQAINNVAFAGTSSSFTFSVGANGSNPSITNFVIQGHDDVSAVVIKETSANAVAAYEGTSVGDMEHRGVFNVVRNSNTYSTIVKSNDGVTFNFSGTINADGSFSGQHKISNYQPDFLDYSFPLEFKYSGSFSGNQLSGTWSNEFDAGAGPSTNSGTFSGTKTL